LRSKAERLDVVGAQGWWGARRSRWRLTDISGGDHPGARQSGPKAVELPGAAVASFHRSVFDTTLPHAVQIADPSHLVKLANSVVDEVRRRVQTNSSGIVGAATTRGMELGGC